MFLQNEGGAKCLVTNGDAQDDDDRGLGSFHFWWKWADIMCAKNFPFWNIHNETKTRTKLLYDGESLKNSRPGTGQHTIIQVPGMVGQISTCSISGDFGH